MKIRKIRLFKILGLSLLVLLLGGSLPAMDLPKVIDKTNCAQYKDILFPAMYRAVEKGDMVVTPGTVNFKWKLPESFLAASQKNAGKFDISSEGEVIEKSTGKIPYHNVYGMPFPQIDPKDPKVGNKIVANYKWSVYRFMASRLRRPLLWIDKSGKERYADGLFSCLYLTGRPPGQEIAKNPDHVLSYELPRILEPMSVKGTNQMMLVYMDPSKEDTSYAYVPAIRRIRQTGTASRSDPFMGSDSWSDMNYGFSGKISSMKWKLIGEKTILVSFTSPNLIPVEELPDGRVPSKFPYTGECFKLNYEVPGFTGAAWAPAPGVITYAPRKVWVVEQMPKDPYYNWGLHVNYIDQETYNIWYKEVYERSGDFRTWFTNFFHYSESPSGKNNIGDSDAQVYIDEKARHCTVSSTAPHPEDFLYIPASKLDASFFSVSNFLLLSK
ncbi:MAG: DUF1329 domain-containing protein [Proteobacteria bacterium]|nr:DUF1329 domain-containing protein [Pseudomonadota bacterium]